LSLLRGPSLGLVVSEKRSGCSSSSDRKEKSGLVPNVITSRVNPQDSEVRQVKLGQGKDVPTQLKESEP
jgi:hypothetical protein